MSDTVTIYITKDAPTKGIVVAEADIGADGWACVRNDRSGPFGPETALYGPSSYRRELSSAIADAQRRRTKRLAALEKQIAAMKALDLTRPINASPEDGSDG